ncbi:hypothetical protein EVJ58_g7040 [Rhodofomes roseus]|uniref:Uncharacterized protein n=1 Tax=Rhodofomes roseus TaxID=34475 RepID=A0A4Y9Y5S9_9APHY|nr:hypothetical protein EVJ58_g7040 [Rhodofomes roseus]
MFGARLTDMRHELVDVAFAVTVSAQAVLRHEVSYLLGYTEYSASERRFSGHKADLVPSRFKTIASVSSRWFVFNPEFIRLASLGI